MCVCVLILISLFFSVPISFFLLVSSLPLYFDLKSVICVVYVYKNPMPSSIINTIIWTLQIILNLSHHCRCHSRRTQVTTCFGSLTLFIFLFVTPFVYFMFVGQHHLHHCSKCDWFVFVHVCMSLQRESMTMVVLMKKKMNDFVPSQCTNIKESFNSQFNYKAIYWNFKTQFYF